MTPRGRLNQLVVSLYTLAALLPSPRGATAQPLGRSDGAVRLSTVPSRVYREEIGGDGASAVDGFVFYVVVQDSQNRALRPRSAHVDLMAGSQVLERADFAPGALASLQGNRFTKRAGIIEVFDLRHALYRSAADSIDRVVYSLQLEAPDGRTLTSGIEIPVLRYTQKTPLHFPLKGVFIVVKGHSTDLVSGHQEWSQMYAYDVIGLGEHWEVVHKNGGTNEDFIGWGRAVYAPADGRVVYSRNDVPDNPRPGEINSASWAKLPNPDLAAAGNQVVLDHGNREFSFLAHFQHGSVRVRAGDRVRRGDLLGLLGNSGNSQGPHLHYHLMADSILYRSDGLPSRFDNTDLPIPPRGEPSEAK